VGGGARHAALRSIISGWRGLGLCFPPAAALRAQPPLADRQTADARASRSQLSTRAHSAADQQGQQVSLLYLPPVRQQLEETAACSHLEGPELKARH
jgi:hypothetical protein